jgi:hypothetical protein
MRHFISQIWSTQYYMVYNLFNLELQIKFLLVNIRLPDTNNTQSLLERLPKPSVSVTYPKNEGGVSCFHPTKTDDDSTGTRN